MDQHDPDFVYTDGGAFGDVGRMMNEGTPAGWSPEDFRFTTKGAAARLHHAGPGRAIAIRSPGSGTGPWETGHLIGPPARITVFRLIWYAAATRGAHSFF